MTNPSAIFLSTHAQPVPGSCVLVTLEGTRPLLVEVQALVDSGGTSPRRLSVGLDRDRLAMLLAIHSSLRGKPLPRGFVAFGEVGLAGEVRPAPRGQERLKEAAKLGFAHALVPKANAPKKAIEGLTVHAVERVEEAMDVVRGLG